MLTGITRKRNKEGKPWAAMTLEDRSGSVEALVFATSYERLAPQVVEDQAVLVRGAGAAGRERAAEDFGAGHRGAGQRPRGFAGRDFDPRLVGQQRRRKGAGTGGAIPQASPDETQVRLRLEAPRDFSVLLDVPAKVRPDKEFRAAIEQICGADAIERVAG